MLKKLKYWLGKFIQKGIINQLFLLLIIIIAIILCSSYLMSILFNIDFNSMLWKNFMHLIDQGTITGEEGGVSYLAFLTSITLIGIFLWSTVVAILNEGIRNKLDILRNTITNIEEKNHIIVLGWDESIPFLLQEYSQTDIKTVVIICEENEEELYPKIKSLKLKKLEVLIKQGEAHDISILEKLNFEESKAIVVFPQDDENALKQILAIKKTLNPLELEEKKNVAIIINDNVYKEIFLSLDIKNAKIVCINREELLQKITVQSIVFDGLISILSELLSYRGNEFYIINNQFADYSVLDISKECFNFGYILVGYVSSNDNKIHTNPSTKTILSKNDKLILIAPFAPSFSKFKTNAIEELKPVSEIASTKEVEIIKNILTIGKRGKLFSIIDSTYKNQIHSINHLKPEDIQEKEHKIDFLIEYICKNSITRILLNSISETDDTDLMAIYVLLKHCSAEPAVKEQINSVIFRVNAIENTILLSDYNDRNLIISGHIIAGLLGQATLVPQIFELIDELLNCHNNEFGIIAIPDSVIQKTFQESYEYFLSEQKTERKTLIGIRREGIVHLNPPATTVLLPNDRLIVIADFVDKF